jgi:hypothetical protein
LNTRTKHTIAKDRLVVAEQRILDAERRKSATNLQLLAYEQKQLEKKLSSLHNLDHSIQRRNRSTSGTNLHRSSSWNDTLDLNHSSSYNSNQNLLSLPNNDGSQRLSSAYSDTVISASPTLHSDEEDHSKVKKKKAIRPPLVAIIPPEEDTIL